MKTSSKSSLGGARGKAQQEAMCAVQTEISPEITAVLGPGRLVRSPAADRCTYCSQGHPTRSSVVRSHALPGHGGVGHRPDQLPSEQRGGIFAGIGIGCEAARMMVVFLFE
jgi:hypothetical protein